MANIDTIRRITIKAQVEGAAEAASALDRVRVSTKNLGASSEEAAKNMLSNENAVKRNLRSYEDLYAATEKLTRIQKDNVIAVAAGRLTQDRANAIFLAAQDRLTGLNKEIERNARVNEEASRATEAMKSKYDQVYGAGMKYAQALGEISVAQKANAISSELAGRAALQEARAYNDQVESLGRLAKAKANAASPGWGDLSKQGQAQSQNYAASNALGGMSGDGSVPTTKAFQAQEAAAVAAAAKRGEAVAKEEERARANKAAVERQVQGQTITPNRAADIAAYAEELRKTEETINPLIKYQRQYAEAVEYANNALRMGATDQKGHDAFVSRASATLLNQTNEMNKADAANARVTKSTGLNAYAWQNLGFQVNDVITSLASGISPMQTIAQQGGQVTQILQSDQGGLVGGLKSIKGKILELLSPARLVFGGIATMAAAAAYATYDYQSGQSDLRRQVSGAGRASGATVGGINEMSASAGAAAGVSTSSAREMAGAFAATGKIGMEMYSDLIKGSRDFALVTGMDSADATKALAEGFADPVNGAISLNKQLGFLDFTMQENIRRMQESGDRLGAQKLLMSGVADATKDAGERLSFFAKQWNDFKNTSSNEIDAIGKTIAKGLGMDDAESQLKTLQGQKDFRSRNKGSLGGLFDGLIGFDDAQIDKDIATVKAKIDKAKAESDKSAIGARSLEVGQSVKSLNPTSTALDDLKRKAENFRKALEQDGVPDPLGNVRKAMDGILLQTAQMAKDMAAGGASFADAVRAAEFGKKTVAYAPTALSTAQINEQQDNKRLAALREAASDTDTKMYDARIASIEKERALLLDTQKIRTTIESSSGSGRYSMGVGQAPDKYRDTIIASSNTSGVNADLLTAQIKRESSFNPNAVSPAGAQGISQFMPPTARGMGLKDPFDPTQAIMKQGELMAQLLKQFNGNEVAALIGYNAGPRTAERFLKNGSDVSTLPAETQGYLKAILTPPPNSEALVKAQVEQNAQRELERKNLEANAKLYGTNGKALETVTAVNARLTEAQQSGITITESYSAAIRKSEAEKAAIAQQMATTRYGKDATFEREQLGRSSTEQSAFSKARSVVGDTTSPAAQFIIEQETMTANMKELKSAATDSLGGFATDIAHGATAMQALASQTTKWADKLLNLAADQAVTSLFKNFLSGGGSSGSGGGLGSLLSMLGGSGSGGGGSGDFGGGLADVPMYANGGVSNGPGIFGEAGPEAAVPLPDGRRIPVHITTPVQSNDNSAGGSGVFAPTVSVAIHTNGSSGDPAADRRNAEENARQAKQQVENLVVELMHRETRPGGVLYKSGARRSNA